MGAGARRSVVVSVLLALGMLIGLAHARPFAQDAHEGMRGTGGGPPAIRGAAPGAPERGSPPEARPKGPSTVPPGCSRAARTTDIEEAFDIALERWIRSARGVYGKQYDASTLTYSYDLSYDTPSGNHTTGEVTFDASVYDKELEMMVSASGVIDVRFAKMGCNWRLVSFDIEA